MKWGVEEKEEERNGERKVKTRTSPEPFLIIECHLVLVIPVGVAPVVSTKSINCCELRKSEAGKVLFFLVFSYAI